MTWQAYPNEWLTTLPLLKRQLKGTGSVSISTWDDDLLSDFIKEASSGIIRNLQRLPLPYTATLTVDYSKRYIDYYSTILTVSKDADLLAISSITNGDSTSVAASKYVLEPYYKYPKERIALKVNSGVYWKPASTNNWRQVITIVGTFGYVPHYDNAWTDSGADINEGGAFSSSDTTLTVTDGTVFSVGDYIQIDSETLFVSAVSTNDLTVKRGKLGTTAASHTDGSDINLFEQKNDLQRAATQWAAHLYKTKDKIGEDVVIFNGGITAPRGLSPHVIRIIANNRKVDLDGFNEY